MNIFTGVFDTRLFHLFCERKYGNILLCDSYFIKGVNVMTQEAYDEKKPRKQISDANKRSNFEFLM